MSLNYKQLDDIFDFAIKYKFGTISFQDYIPKISDISLRLSNQQKEYVLEKIRKFKKINKIIVHTNISLNNGDFKVGKDSNKKRNSSVIENIILKEDISKYYDIEKKFTDDISNIFCLSPWKVLCIDSYNNIRFACLSKAIKCRTSYFDVWNCKDILDYRISVLYEDYSICNKSCLNNGDYSLKTKIGVL